MPQVVCKKCGGITNSACSDYWLRKPFVEGEATGCYSRYENGKWVKGCSFDGLDPMTKLVMSSLWTDEAERAKVKVVKVVKKKRKHKER